MLGYKRVFSGLTYLTSFRPPSPPPNKQFDYNNKVCPRIKSNILGCLSTIISQELPIIKTLFVVFCYHISFGLFRPVLFENTLIGIMILQWFWWPVIERRCVKARSHTMHTIKIAHSDLLSLSPPFKLRIPVRSNSLKQSAAHWRHQKSECNSIHLHPSSSGVWSNNKEPSLPLYPLYVSAPAS